MESTKKNKNVLRTIGITLFVIYIFILCFSWSTTIEFDGAPDEAMKYDVCEYLCENLKLPHGGEESIREPTWGISYAFTPIVSYMFSAMLMKIAMIFTENIFQHLIAARLVSVLCMVGYSIMNIKIAKQLFKGVYQWLFVVFTTLLPQVVFLGSYLNNDSFALFSISIIVYGWILGLKNNWNWKSCIIMAIGIGICALSYYNAYGYILGSVILYCTSCYSKKISWNEFLKKGIIIAFIAFAIAGWWFVRNFILYDGDFIGIKTQKEYAEQYAVEKYKPSKRPTPQHKNVSLMYMLQDMKWIEITKKSFIGTFGYMDIPMDNIIYQGYESIFLVGIIGMIISWIKARVRKKKRRENQKQRKEKKLWNMAMVISLIIPILLSLYYSYYSDFQPQGRYIMPMIIPFMYFIVRGIRTFLNTFARNKKIQNIIVSLIIVIWTCMPIYIFFTYIKPM